GGVRKSGERLQASYLPSPRWGEGTHGSYGSYRSHRPHKAPLPLGERGGRVAAPQPQQGDLRPAAVAHRDLAADAPADVQEGRALLEGAAVVAPAIPARHQQRTKDREANLAAVDVPRQHQVDVVPAGPGDVVGR